MARPSKEPPLRSSLVPAIVRHAAARGLDVEALSLRFGLPSDVARCEEVSAGADVPDGLLHDLALASEPDVAFHVARHLESRRQKLVELAVGSCARAEDALVLLARWVPLLQEGLEASLDEGRWVLRTPRRPRGMGRHVHELVLAHALHRVRAVVLEVPVCRVWFAHARPADLSATCAFFGTDDLAFGLEDSGFAVERASLGRSTRQPDPRTVETIAPLVDAELGSRRSSTARASTWPAGYLRIARSP
jgi:hypothetical protein